MLQRASLGEVVGSISTATNHLPFQPLAHGISHSVNFSTRGDFAGVGLGRKAALVIQ